MFGWLAAHLPLWPSIGLAVAGLIWTAAVRFANPDDNDDPGMPIAVLGGIAMAFALVGSIMSGSWVLWLPYLAGCSVVPALMGLAAGLGHVEERRLQAAAERKAKACELEKQREAFERSPAGVIARCERTVERYVASLPKDMDYPEESRKARTKLEALKALHARLQEAEQAGATGSFSRA